MAKRSRKKATDHEKGSKNDVVAALAEIDDEWGETEEKSFAEVPDGKYQVRIDKVSVNNSKTSGRLQVSWELGIVAGPNKNRKLFKHDGIDDEESRSWFRGALARLGVEWPKKASVLPGVLEELQGSFAQVTARTKADNDIQNVYFDKALDSDDIDEDLDELEDEDEKPKKGKASKDEDEKPKKGKTEPEEEPLEIEFTKKDLTKKHKRHIAKLAEALDFDTDDYESDLDVLADLAEHLEVEGTFDDPDELIEKVQEAADE